MIKKQLGVLAGSVLVASSSLLVASGASAALVGGTISTYNGPGTDGTLVLALISDTGAGGTILIDTGHSVSSLQSGVGFSLDISAASALLPSVDQYALFGVIAGTYTGYITGSGFGTTGGFIYGATAPGPIQGTGDTINTIASGFATYINQYALNVGEGIAAADGTAADFDSVVSGTDTLFGGIAIAAGDAASIYFQNAENGTFTTAVQVQIAGLTGSGAGSEANFVVSAVPVPAAAWLFGSALLGLGVVRRRS